ncbi:MAG: radical SAM protein [Candidatus Hydrothermarchaeota archaeon]
MGVRPNLRFINWDITSTCNLRCAHCRNDVHSKLPGELTLEEAKGLIDSIAGDFQIEWISMGGGEPLMREGLFEIIRHAGERGIKVVLNSNGYLIDAAKAREIRESGVVSVQISMDGLEETHDRFRGKKGAFKRCLAAIENLQREGVRTTVRATLTKDTARDILPLIELLKARGVKTVGVGRAICVGRSQENKDTRLSKEEYRDIMTQIFRQEGIEIRSADPVSFMVKPHFFEELEKRHRDPLKVWGGCAAGVGVLFLTSDGNAQPCSVWPVSLGNVREKSIKEIWETSPVLKELRTRDQLKGKCGLCKYKYLCGGCRADSHGLYGDYLIEDPMCWYEPEAA